MRCRVWAVAVVVALAAAAPAEARQTVFGFNDVAIPRGADLAAVGALLHRTGARAYRMTITWQAVQPSPGVWRWGEFDRTYDRIRAAGLRPVIVPGAAPRWAQETGPNPCDQLLFPIPTARCNRPPGRARLGDWAAFLKRAAARYPAALGFEIFNEPNVAANWLPRADPEYYVAVLRAAYGAIKAVDPAMPVVSGGLAFLNERLRPGSIDAPGFLARMYAAGARGAMDGIGIHPYSYPFDPRPADSAFTRNLDAVRRVRAAAGDDATRFWITEFGYHTGSPVIGGVDRATQAVYVGSVVRRALALPDVSVALLQSLVDFGTNRNLLDDSFGLVDVRLAPKPALAAVEEAVPPAIELTRAPRSLRVRCPRRPPRRCVRSGYVTLALSKDASIRLRLSARRRRGLTLTRAAAAGYVRIRLSVRRGGRTLPPGRYRLRLAAVDRFGNRSETTSRTLLVR